MLELLTPDTLGALHSDSLKGAPISINLAIPIHKHFAIHFGVKVFPARLL